jgi:hypothetical protein
MILMRADPFRGPLEGVGPESRDFLGPEMATNNGFARIKIIKSKRYIKNMKIGNFLYMSFARILYCLLYSVLFVVYCTCEGTISRPPPSPAVQSEFTSYRNPPLPTHTGIV